MPHAELGPSSIYMGAYSQAFIGVPGGALDLGGTRTIGTSAMADDRVPRFAEIPRNPQFGTC